MSNKILLIENQYVQFKKITKYLNDKGYIVCPSDEVDSFQEFIDLVRIYLNPRYGGIEIGSRRDKVFESIVKKINEENFDVLILDYILVGCHVGLTGIFLAEKLRKKGIETPMIFLSREEQYKPEVINNLKEDLEPYEWIHKGYDGREILEIEYFNEYVISGIDKCIGKSVLALIDIVSNSETFKNYKSQIDNLKKKNFSKEQIIDLKEFITNLPLKTTVELDALLKSLGNAIEYGN